MRLRHCGCRYWTFFWGIVLFWPCDVFVASLKMNDLPGHEDFARSCMNHMPLKKGNTR